MRTSYLDIKADLLDRVRSNRWPPGTLVPGEIALALEFGCARATVNRAMRELVAEGILDRKRKTGTRVRASPARRAQFAIPLIHEEIRAIGATYRYALVQRRVLPAPPWLRARLDLPADARALHLQCLHHADNRPYQVEDRWINLGAVPDAEGFDFDTVGPNEWLVREVPFTEGELVFSATRASAAIAALLNVAEGEAVFTIERSTWLQDQSVTLARLYFARDYRLTARF